MVLREPSSPPDPFFDACEQLLLLLPDGGPWAPAEAVAPWRMRERMKTVALALVLALNLGVDPPDVVRPCPNAPELSIRYGLRYALRLVSWNAMHRLSVDPSTRARHRRC